MIYAGKKNERLMMLMMRRGHVKQRVRERVHLTGGGGVGGRFEEEVHLIIKIQQAFSSIHADGEQSSTAAKTHSAVIP